MAQSQNYALNGGRESSTSMEERIANGLGWFSVGLGLAEVIAPGPTANFIGVRNNAKTRKVLRGYGVRELAAGVGILSQTRPAGWLWSRVAGDALDLASLGSALPSRGTKKARVVAAAAAVVGVTALDIYCGARLSSTNGSSAARSPAKVRRSIIVDRPAEEVYRFWRDLENLPKFMKYLQSVRVTGDRRSHWVARGPGGKTLEWDAEILVDQPDSAISWHSVDGSAFRNSGSVRFERAPGGRGTLLSVEMEYGPAGSLVTSGLSKIMGVDPGQRIAHDLRNFKQVLELGEVTQSDASIHPGMYPAQPPSNQPA